MCEGIEPRDEACGKDKKGRAYASSSMEKRRRKVREVSDLGYAGPLRLRKSRLKPSESSSRLAEDGREEMGGGELLSACGRGGGIGQQQRNDDGGPTWPKAAGVREREAC